MSRLHALRHRLRALLHPERHARELREEMQFHLSLEAMQQEHAGRGAVTAADARFAARRLFGNITSYTEETRQMAGLGALDVARQDLRFALRSFRRTPGFTAIVVLTLAIGIGANTAIFSAVDAMLLRPLPFREPERLMVLSLTAPPRNGQPPRNDVVWSYPKFAAFRDAQTVFGGLALSADFPATVGAGGDAERIVREMVNAGYLATLGIRPALGRGFLPEEDRAPGGPRVAVLGDALWRRLFNADSAVLGRPLEVDGKPYTVVGVLPAGFRGISGRAEFLVPVMSQDPEMVIEPWSHSFTIVGRLKPGVTVEGAKAAMPRLGAVVDRAFPDPEIPTERWSAAARLLDATRVAPSVRRSLLVLLGAVGLVLLIACANVANLFLVRAEGRRREIAVRLAIGAGRRRLVRQLLTESVLLSAMGGVASVVVAWWGVRLLTSIAPAGVLEPDRFSRIGVLGTSAVHLDVTALAFTGALAIASGLLFGLVPAMQATRPALAGALRDGGGGTRGGLRRPGSRQLLVGLEIALAVVLLAGSGLMVRSLSNLLGVSMGFDSERVLTMRLNTRPGFGRDSLPSFYDQLEERLAALPGVTSVGFTGCQPLNGGCNGTVIRLHDRPVPPAGSEPDVGVHWVSPRWHATMRVPLVRGRLFTGADRQGARKVVLVNESAARKFWPGADPLGKRVSVGQGGFWEDTAYVVGVVGDVRYVSLDSAPTPDVYLSYYQSPRGSMMLYLRTEGNPAALAAAARHAANGAAPGAPMYDVMTLRERVKASMAAARFRAALLSLFAAVALVLATLGTYGVISFAVAQRAREIGVRIALGARAGDIIRLVVRQGLALVAAGTAVGVVAALAITRVLRSLLFGVTPSDPATFGVIVGVLVAAVVLASWLPARRAAAIEPMEALREG